MHHFTTLEFDILARLNVLRMALKRLSGKYARQRLTRCLNANADVGSLHDFPDIVTLERVRGVAKNIGHFFKVAL